MSVIAYLNLKSFIFSRCIKVASNNLLQIILDNRERKLIDIFSKKKDQILLQTKQLDVADIIITNEIAIERKTGFDFVVSIMDNRLFEQLLRLKDTYSTPILIIEGLNDEVFDNTGMKISSIYGALAYVSYKLGISVIPTRNIDDTAIVIERIAIREQIEDKAPIISRKAPKGLSIEERMSFIIEGLFDTGPKKAVQLIDHFKTPYNVLKAIKQSFIIYTRTGNPKGIEGPLNKIKGFGHNYIEKNKELIFGIKKANKEIL